MPARIERVDILDRGPWLVIGPVRRAERVRVVLHVPSAPAHGLRLLHLSDLHLRRGVHPLLENLVAELARDPPDLVLVTGDFVDDKIDPAAALPALERTVPRLCSRLGTYAILGNHDGDLLGAHLPRLGVTLVGGRRVRVGAGDLDLVGLAGVAREDDAELLELERDESTPLVALSHYPDIITRCGRLRPDLVLAGHTHGGQICLPGQFPLLTHDSLPRHMCCGAHETPNGCLVVSRGIGHTELPVRLFAPPQVVEVVLRGNASVETR